MDYCLWPPGRRLDLRNLSRWFQGGRRRTDKCCATVYGAPTQTFSFDTDFLDPAKLPPQTPVFRDVRCPMSSVSCD